MTTKVKEEAVNVDETCPECGVCTSCGLCATEIEIFEGLSREEHLMLTAKSDHREHKKNDVIFNYDDEADKIIIVRHGKVKLSNFSEDGKEYIYDILTDGDIIGEQTLFSGGVFGMDGIAITEVGTCILTKDIIEDLILEHPRMGINLIETIGRKLSETREHARILSINNPKKRLAEFLVARSNTIKSPVIELSMENIASSINLSRETVSRKMSELTKEELVELQGYKKIIILDKAELLNN